MGTITSTVGPISGIDFGSIVDQLIQIEARPKDLAQAKIDKLNEKTLAYTTLSARLTTLKLTGTSLKKPSTFQLANAVSSDDSVLTATTSRGASIGSYQFRVARLVTTQQNVSKGFAAPDAAVKAGTMTVEVGGGDLTRPTQLNQLNGGEGVRRGEIRVTDRGGNSAVVDLSGAVDLNDVVNAINSAGTANVRASVKDDHLVIEDRTGLGSGTLRIEDVGAGFAATDLKIVGTGSGNTLTGGDVLNVARSTRLSTLKDGNGIRSVDGDDFAVTLADGSNFNVDLGESETLGEVIDAIQAAGAGKVTVSIDDNTNALRITDNTYTGTPPAAGGMTFAALNGSTTAADLGLNNSTTGTTNGKPLIAGMNSVLLSQLNGGAGLAGGTISIQNRSGGNTNINLNNVTDVSGLIQAINDGGAGVTASLNDARNGIAIKDNTGGGGNLVIGDVSGTLAADLGIDGTHAASAETVRGSNLQHKWFSQNTQLSNLNGGRGIVAGSFKVTDSAGGQFTVNLDSSARTIGDVIDAINLPNRNVVASINETGDGLLLTDTAGGALTMNVEDISGTMAKSLYLAGDAVAGKIDGTYEKKIEIAAGDTLTDVQTKIRESGYGVFANILSDGSASTPYRLSISAQNSGTAGRVTFDVGDTGLGMSTLVEASDAAVFYGSPSAAQPVLITASRNQISGIIPGVNLSLNGVSNDPVTLNVNRSSEDVRTQVTSFVEEFNSLVGEVAEATKFDIETNTRGLLLGETSVQTLESTLYRSLQTVVAENGKYRILADVGMRVVDGGKVEFDESKFDAAFGDDPEAVARLFTNASSGFGSALEAAMTKMIDPVNGVFTSQTKSIERSINLLENRVEDLDGRLEARRKTLLRQFVKMEQSLANLQGQQTALNQFQPIQNNNNNR